MITLFLSRKKINYFWGLVDVSAILIYVSIAFNSGEVPYVSGIFFIIDTVSSHGGVVEGVFLVAVFMLQLSVWFSAILFFSQSRSCKIFGTVQSIFRVLFVVPSIPYFMEFARMISENMVLVFVLLIVIEAIKVSSLWQSS